MIYGSKRIGMEQSQSNKEMVFIPGNFFVSGLAVASSANFRNSVNDRSYELSNHLGNVLNTISDRKVVRRATSSSTTSAFFDANVQSASDYYPFGQTLPGRNTGDYRYGFKKGDSYVPFSKEEFEKNGVDSDKLQTVKVEVCKIL